MSSNSLKTFKNNLGFLLQLAALTLLPLVILRQLSTGFQLLWMPALTMLGIVLFMLGQWLREPE
ncbi:hypothetical protein [Thalassoglobus polymorphus]|uniref:hypothetical protein n=1 Tax=Thalassoglobus polymorphus TaxID=2527994 RepID=UPI0018D23A3B|nr:hypothetical protein [Thalassoglobus polymorphus]